MALSRPLAPADAALVPSFQNPGSIFVTELKALDERSAATTQQVTTSTSHVANLDVRTKLLESPYLAYDFALFYSKFDPGAPTRYTITNSLILNHTFNEVFSVGARAGREDGEDSLGTRSAYTLGATLTATPFRTWSNTLAYSGRFEQVAGKTNDSNSVSVNSILELYRGVSVNTGAGASFITNEFGDTSRSLNYIFGANVAPRRDLTMSLYYTASKVKSTIAATGKASDITSQRGDLAFTYRPFSTLYLTSAFSVLEQSGQRTDISQNYGVNWTPFPDGTLQFGVAYNQSMRNVNGESNRIITPSATWQITPRTLLQLSFPMISTDSDQGSTESQVYSAQLRTSF